MLKTLYILVALLIIGGYGYVSYRGMEVPKATKGVAPQGVRGAHGGARTFWYGGYRGGK
ncbi:MAG: hypothetical protein ABI779_11965 [Acidobacteriota bacterium]